MRQKGWNGQMGQNGKKGEICRIGQKDYRGQKGQMDQKGQISQKGQEGQIGQMGQGMVYVKGLGLIWIDLVKKQSGKSQSGWLIGWSVGLGGQFLSSISHSETSSAQLKNSL